MAQRSEQNITGLMETSARTTQDMLELRQEIDGCGTLSGLAAMARKSEQDILGIMETSANNAQAILELRQEIAGCVAVKTTVDDIKTRQLMQIRENITRVKTSLDDMTTRYSTLNEKYSEAFDALNIRVDTVLCEGIPPTLAPTCAMRFRPQRLHRMMAPQRLHRLMWSRTRPQQGMGNWTRVTTRICLAPMPRTDDRSLITHVTRTDPIFPEHDFRDTGGSSSVRWRPQLDPCRSPHENGTFQREEGNFGNSHGTPRTPTNPYYGSRDTLYLNRLALLRPEISACGDHRGGCC